MSDPLPHPRRVLHLIVEGFPHDNIEELAKPSPETNAITEIFPLTEANAKETLEKIFAADTVAVWGTI